MGEKQQWVEQAWSQVLDKTLKNSKRIGASFPHASKEGKYDAAEPYWWTAGFWPGQLWLLYNDSRLEELKQIAVQCEEKLDAVLDGYTRLDHDLGFMWTLTSLANYKLHGGEVSRVRALKAANYLAARFNLKGQYIRAWNPWYEGEENAGVAIIDCVMNVPLLFWASKESGDPRYAHIAEAHMDTVVRYFIREDGSVNHIVRFDALTGEYMASEGGQGHAPDSAWSRGAAWAIYGLALAYQHTGKQSYLAASQLAANFFIARLPEDLVPQWDFRAPADTLHLRDSSAGAIAASGLLVLAKHVQANDSVVYRNTAVQMLHSLYENYSTFGQDDEEGLILHGTSNYPQGTNIDVPLIYGDFYFVEGLARLLDKGPFYWE